MYTGKVELHLHLDGSMSIPFAEKYIERCGVPRPADWKAAMSVSGGCQNLNDYLRTFDLPKRLLQYGDVLEDCAYDIAARLARQGLIYAEIRFAPEFHCGAGLTQADAIACVLQGLRRAERDYPSIQTGLLICFIVGHEERHPETLKAGLHSLGNGVAGFDLAGAEGRVPMGHYRTLFEQVRSAGAPFTIHAGECGSWENIAAAVSFGARRIGHGVAAIQSQECMELLRERGTVVECCFTSNLQTKAVLTPESHPIDTFFRRGIAVTVNTDNTTVSDTDLAKEHRELKKYFPFTDQDFLEMDRNALRGAFIPEPDRQLLLERLNHAAYN